MKSAFLDKTASLTPLATRIICDKATEAPFTGAYQEVASTGSYLCRRCGLALFRADSQFSASCGWPSFDKDITHAVKTCPDVDGQRTEIQCARCNAHLGHVFIGEYLTANNRRYCVNGAALDFVDDTTVIDSEEAIVAGGCFWGVEHHLRNTPGVLQVEVGYTGGILENPSYERVCTGKTGHYEAVRVLFDTEKTAYCTILQRFFEIHDASQAFGQGADIGPQYESAIFCYNTQQHEQANQLIENFNRQGNTIVTKVLDAHIFWPAEIYHQNYYAKHNHSSATCGRMKPSQ